MLKKNWQRLNTKISLLDLAFVFWKARNLSNQNPSLKTCLWWFFNDIQTFTTRLGLNFLTELIED